MSENTTWKEKLDGQMAADLAGDIDVFAGQIELKRQGKLEDNVFAETRLRRGVYGQRYDNGQRHDGQRTRQLIFPAGDLTKGADTAWDAPGMQRIKLPFGAITPDQLEVMAALAEEYADGILHITTRQDIQLHYVHIEATPDLMRRLAAVGVTTQEACGNVVRNVTACPRAGVCHSERFDVTPYANTLAQFLLGHDDAQDFGRKFKIAFSGCAHEACGLAQIHDLGLLAKTEIVDGIVQRGFALYVGGGLGTVPHQAQLLADFVPETAILPYTQAIVRVFARLGEKKNRNRARLKFLVARLGIDAFRELVLAERALLPVDERWTAYVPAAHAYQERPRRPAVPLNGSVKPAGFQRWQRTNVRPQRQTAFSTVAIHLPLGDFSADQARQLAAISRKYGGDQLRATVEQNILLRWVSDADLPALFSALEAAGLGAAGAGTIADITTCPGTDTCKLGIASSRGLTGELRQRLTAQLDELPDAARDLRIKVSGCFNACGQHHVADIGFFGNSRRRNDRTVPHFQVVLGGRWRDNGGAYGQAVGAIPSRVVPDALRAITERYLAERAEDEDFQAWTTRRGKKAIRDLLAPFTEVPTYEARPDFYSDWGDPREFSIGDMGVGECAGAIVSLFSIEIAQAEGEAFEALVLLDDGDFAGADARAYRAMLLAAKALVRGQFLDVGDAPDQIVAEFRRRFYDTRLFFDRYAKGKFAHYLFQRHENPPTAAAPITEAAARQLVAEANLFIEAAHACDARSAGALAGGVNL